MDLIDRYLDAVRFFLPRAQRDDILDELRDLLLSRREAREAELGRPLSRKEDEALLHDFGHPLAVAGRYGPQQYLIGPELYPIYSFVVKLVLAVLMGSAVIAGIVGTVAVGPGHGLGVALGVAWTGLFVAVGAVTVVFTVAQRTGAGRRMVDRWSVHDLPRFSRRPRRRKPLAQWYEHVAGIVVQTIFILWWVGLLRRFPPELPLKDGAVLHFAFAAGLEVLYLPVLALAAGAIAVNALKLGGRDVRAIAHATDMVVQAGVIAVAGFALHVGRWAVITGVGESALTLSKVQLGVNIGAEVTLIVLICGSLIALAIDAWRILRPAPAAAKAANGA